jgi:sporulation protein YlmC with PRC-barrel domain
MEDLGAPSSYLMLEHGTPVYTSDGERIGKVGEIRADTERDIFDGIVVSGELITADRIEEIFERGVLLAPES